MHRYIARSEIIDRVEHIRDLHRRVHPSGVHERVAYDRREQKTKDLLSNLRRMGDRPTLSLVHDFGRLNSMTVDAAHRLFGYELDAIRENDLLLNGARTHIVESYVFERDIPVELPMELAQADAYSRNAPLSVLVEQWQSDVSIRSLSDPTWKQPGVFYVHVGTEDSLGSSLPPGALALVEPINDEELTRPNPRSVYLLQFPNGYRCSRCVVARGRLQLLSSDRSHYEPQGYVYPGSVRIAGRVGMFATPLPVPHAPSRTSLSSYAGNAPLVLPWEHRNRASLFSTKHKRFIRVRSERRRIHDFLRDRLHSRISERTKRRYRSETESQPHVDALIHLTIEHFVRYSDALRSGGFPVRDRGRFSLETLLRARSPADMSGRRSQPIPPFPAEVWDARRKEMTEWPAIFSLKFPQLRPWEDRLVRIAEGSHFSGTDLPLRAGSWLFLEKMSEVPDELSAGSKHGWSRPLYVLRRELDIFLGHLDRDGDQYALRDGAPRNTAHKLRKEEIPLLTKVCGIAVPI